METIALLITRPDLGGAQSHCYELMKSLGDRYRFHLGTSTSGWLTERAAELGIPVTLFGQMFVPISPWNDLRTVVQVRRWLRTLRPALLHVHSAKAALVGRLAAASVRIPAVYTVHGWAFTEGVSRIRKIQALSTEKAMGFLGAKIVTVSHYDRQLALRNRLPRSNQIEVIPNGLPDTAYRADFTHRRNDTVNIVMVARFESPKNQDLLVRAVSQLQDLPWNLELIGDGPTRAATEQLVAKLGLDRRISMPGPCTDVPSRLARSDIAVLVSSWEALPLTIIEAMRAALPVIASKVGGVPELVEHETNGLLVAKSSASELAQALRTLITQPELRRRMGNCGRQRYEREFTQDLMAQRLSDVYQTCIVATRAAKQG